MSRLAELLREVMDLQESYSSANSPEMHRRGILIRREIPAALASLVDSGAAQGLDLAIEGGDGTGLKAKVPWVRLYSPKSSPSATQGWYIVFLFPIDGSGVYLSLNQGTTSPHRGAFAPRSVELLSQRVTEARAKLREHERVPSDLLEQISLREAGTLGAAYESGNVYARFYASTSLPSESDILRDVSAFVPFLRRLYASDLSATSSERGSYLLTWNPTLSAWPELASLSRALVSGSEPETETNWATASGRILPGDRVFVVRVGQEPKGIVASGFATSRPFEDAHWDGTEGRMSQYVRCRWDFAVDPEANSPLRLETLRDIDPEFSWTPQSSGISIPAKIASKLETSWIAHVRELAPPHVADAARAYGLADLQRDAFFADSEVSDMLDLLRTRLNLVLQGPPGVGKTYLARKLAYALMGEEDDSRIEWIQFHQSFSYEEFVEGFRPTDGGGFKLRQGSFHRFCELAAANSPAPHVFVIDEINRGNLSRIFGELLSLIEEDKRAALSVRLAYSPEEARFTVPTNVYIVGLMNTADRSLAVVDYALRRRFRFVDLDPQFDSAKFRAHLLRMGVSYGMISRISSRMKDLNTAIAEDTRNLGRGFEIGHSYFSPSHPVLDEEGWYRRVIRYEISPLLREYWFDAPDRARSWTDVLLAPEIE